MAVLANWIRGVMEGYKFRRAANMTLLPGACRCIMKAWPPNEDAMGLASSPPKIMCSLIANMGDARQSHRYLLSVFAALEGASYAICIRHKRADLNTPSFAPAILTDSSSTHRRGDAAKRNLSVECTLAGGECIESKKPHFETSLFNSADVNEAVHVRGVPRSNPCILSDTTRYDGSRLHNLREGVKFATTTELAPEQKGRESPPDNQ
ncbi:hypothetical protein DEU56DRAFT_902643 [Suillus clintonianus]|uniref:uncharacterized protein n=1 Tax=Suillus clintonianus TaxID=1904413 RepID=UPI001B87D91A|nr:uncharacterized protein DEU56DRAFT_902643 [Suillus clintonianus]KAG2130709.1 hypothetical protein DEU56DRAFT_902643 [Suillus clintonianus]